MMPDPGIQPSDLGAQDSWLAYALWTVLGFIGAGISVGVKLQRGEQLNRPAVATTLVAGTVTAGACTHALVSFAHLDAGWSGGVALLLGLMAMGFIMNAVDGKIPFINKFTGNNNDKPSA